VPAAAKQLQPIGRLAATNQLHLAIGLPSRNQSGLDEFLKDLQDPASPTYHQYLTPEQFTEHFGPTEADYQAVVDFALANHLNVVQRYHNRVVLSVAGAVADIEKAFRVKMLTYQHPTEARTFYAPDVEPSLALSTPLAHISGLDNYSLPHPKHHRSILRQSKATPHGSGPSGQIWGNDYRNAYVPGATLTGAGQSMGFLEYETYYPSDLTNYVTTALGLTASSTPTVTIVAIDGSVSQNEVGDNGVECSLDLEVSFAMAPGVTNMVVFCGGASASFDDIFETMVEPAYTNILQFSCSWGGGTAADPASETVFKQMQAQGQSFYNATGDEGAFAQGAATLPSDSPSITQVGGSSLSDGPAPTYAWVSESAWDDDSGPSVAVSSCVASSGGFSAFYPIPYWQTNLSYLNSTGTNHASATWRNFPDVAANGEENNEIWMDDGTEQGGWGGTSFAAPQWCGFTALLNQQQKLTSPGKPVGFLNPALYALAQQPNAYTTYFHDAIGGNNLNSSSPASFFCTAGYDLVCGIGTPMGTNLINALTRPPDALVLTPLAGFTASGFVGGPFTGAPQTFTLTNAGASSLSWSLVNTSAWLAVSLSGGVLAAGKQTNLTVSLTGAANGFAVGTYAATVIFSNQTTQVAQLRQFTLQVLQVGQSVVQNGGFETGSFTDWTLVGEANTRHEVYNAVENSSFVTSAGVSYVHSGTYAAVLGNSGSPATLSQSVPTIRGQSYLLSLWLINPASLPTESFAVNWSTNGTAFQTLFGITNPPAFSWTNLTFIVTATGANSTIQFAAENDQDYFGLDDVSLTPIPTLSFAALARTANSLAFTWYSLPGLSYVVQYKTNLAQASWISLSTNTAAAGIASVTNAIGADPQRFYRIQQLP